jgi:hypothetical protein
MIERTDRTLTTISAARSEEPKMSFRIFDSVASAFQTGEHAGICPWPALVHDPGGPPKAPPGSFAPFLQFRPSRRSESRNAALFLMS